MKGKPMKHTLTKAKVAKNDEWYTRMEDVQKELQHYEDQLAGKVVYCPCDDVTWSNFPRYFQQNFDRLKLKGLIASCFYDGTQDLYTVLENKAENKRGYWAEYKGNNTWERHNFNYGHGDFRSDECLELLKRSDVVITNPPFSLFRQFVAWVLDNGKDILTLGTQYATNYKDIFPLVISRKLKLGWNTWFSLRCYNAMGELMKPVPCSWYTTLETKPNPPFVTLEKEYNAEEMPKLSNYDAILINSLKDIPKDYYGEMAVPSNFLKVWNPDQFEITGGSHHAELTPMRFLVLAGSEQGRTINFNKRGIFVPDENGVYMDVKDNSKHRCVFARIFVRRVDTAEKV